MTKQLQLGDLTIDVIYKDIKNVHLSVYPPVGKVRISAPLHMNPETIRVFAISKLGWIKAQRKKLQEQDRETPREYLNRESHYLWGKRYLLTVIEADQKPSIEIKHNRLVIRVRPGTDEVKKRELVEEWYRGQIRQAIIPIIAKWEGLLKVKVERVFIQKMKTKWGSCNPSGRNIRLNTDLAKKPRECLEYIVVHEMLHLIERRHNERFIGLLDQHMPAWGARRDLLNQAPLAHEEWSY
jgi:predicted metal-dependent hydrolase